jgi:tRNA-dihydrouridine synthase B
MPENYVRGFWAALDKPIVALSPMDGVTDAAARRIAVVHGRPDFTVTEFVAVEGLTHGAVVLLDDLRYDPAHRPVVAQLYGVDVAAFREAAAIATALGFDGIDVNMGCPACTVARRGAGAALIQTPDLAREIVRAVRQGVADWANGGTLRELVSHNKVRRLVAERSDPLGDATRRLIPISVKTRIGYDDVVVERWAGELALEEPVALTFHGRTLKQLYSGSANWDAIGRAADRLRGSGILVLGNGDLADRHAAEARIRDYGLDGALIGRATIGNPWALSGQNADLPTRLRTAIEHAELFAELFPGRPFMAARKHLHGYCRGFEGASELRRQLMLAPTAADCRDLIERALLPLAA